MIEFKHKFIEDASDLLNKLEITLLNLEKKPNDSKLIEEVFRAMHTLKGTAGMFGFSAIGELTHRMENIYDLIRNGRIKADKLILDMTLHTIDFINKVLKADEEEEFIKEYASFNNRIDNVLSDINGNIFDGNQREIQNISQQPTELQTWFITIKPQSDLRKRGIKIHTIFDEITEAGQNYIFHRNEKKADESGMFWEIILATKLSESDVEDIFLFVEDISKIHHLSEVNLFENKRFAEELEEFAKLPKIDIEFLRSFLSDATEDETPKTDEVFKIEGRHLENIKVPAERLDEQMTLLSELVTTKAEIQLVVHQSGYKNLMKAVEQLDKITRRFRKNIFKIRLIPLETLQLRFNRLIRDLSAQLGKKVNFITDGMATELDKTIIDSLESPLMHLIRNCLDHGIEAADIRKMRGKPGNGIIELSARQAATNVFITVRDDGEGISASKIREKAIQKGIINKNEKLSNDQLYELIFKPGFTTAQSLTEVSGRGVGMDVVKQTVNNLRGSIDVKSEKGKGTSFTIKLPLTLSIIDTMLVKSDQMYYSIPLTVIDKCTEIKKKDLIGFDNQHIIIDDELLPYIIIKDKLKITDDLRLINYESNQDVPTLDSSENQKSKIVIVRNETQKTALIVDEVIGEHQAVLKPLGEYFKAQPFITGASQLADGHIAFVLDTTKLIIN